MGIWVLRQKGYIWATFLMKMYPEYKIFQLRVFQIALKGRNGKGNRKFC